MNDLLSSRASRLGLWLRGEQTRALSIVLPQRHHAQIAVDVEDEWNDARQRLQVEVAVVNFHREINRKEGEIDALGVDPVR
jgi:hypothetical protein